MAPHPEERGALLHEQKLRHLSLFAGIEGFGYGLERTGGFKTIGQVEIDRFCRRVLDRHYPNVTRALDVRDVRGDEFGPVDVVTFGSPCQDLSVAGQRAGLAGERSGLFFEAARIIRECRPTFAIWENVPGAFSSNDGRDFRAVLMAMGDLGPDDVAWRVVDSQHAGVPQRRRRIFLVADFRGRRAGEILFEPTRCAGHLAPGREEGQNVAGTVGGGAYGAGRRPDNLCDTLVPTMTSGNGDAHRGFRDERGLVIAGTLAAGAHPSGFNGRDAERGNIVVAHPLKARGNNGSPERGDINLVDVAHSLRADGHDASEDGTGRGTPLVIQEAQTGTRLYESARSLRSDAPGSQPTGSLVFDPRQITSRDNRSNPQAGDPAHPLHSGEAPIAILQDIRGQRDKAQNGIGVADPVDPMYTLDGVSRHGVAYRKLIRRLTPTECERLQGFPDGYTCLCGCDPYSTTACRCPDGPRYKGCGNAVTTTVITWLGYQILAVVLS